MKMTRLAICSLFLVTTLYAQIGYGESKDKFDVFLYENYKNTDFFIAFKKLNFHHIESRVSGSDAVVSRRFFLINYLVSYGNEEIFIKMGECDFPFYKALAAIALRRFESEESNRVREKLLYDETEVLKDNMDEGDKIVSTPSIKIKDIVRSEYFDHYCEPPVVIHDYILNNEKL